MHIIVTGNVVDGLKFIGPYVYHDDAQQAAVNHVITDEWIIAELIPSEAPEWSGSPDPSDPDNYWIDDKTGERVNDETGERTRT